ncbi:zinc finger protein, partial [Rickenella mellea]
ATSRSWNGHAFECFLCHGDFRTLHSLNAHLQSPKHQEKIYRCPQSTCQIEVSAMSSLIQHVENGSCGVRMFKQVQDTIDGLVRGMQSIAY